jgi:hypothetical protein
MEQSFLSIWCYLCQSTHSLHVMEQTVFTRPTTCRYSEADQSNPRFSPWFLRIHYDILLSTTKFSKLSLPLTFPTTPLYELLLSHTCYTPSSSHFTDLITRIIFGEEYESWKCSLFNLIYSPVTSPPLSPGVLPAILFSYIPCQCFCLNLGDQISYPNNTTGKIIVLYISIFAFFGYQIVKQKSLYGTVTSIPWY